MQISIVSIILFAFVLSKFTEGYNNLPSRRLQHSKLFSCLYGDLLHSDDAGSVLDSEPIKCVLNETNEVDSNSTISTTTCPLPDGQNEPRERGNSRLKAASIAQNAAQVAKAANEAQASAAQDAAKQVKMQLAEKAIQAARAAEAVLEGKQVIVDNFEREIREADAVVNQVTSSMESSEANAESAQAVAKAAESQLNTLKTLMQQAISSLADVESLGELAHSDLEEKTQMLATAKARADRLIKQVAQAKEDYDSVKDSAYHAACAAVEAKQKAASSSRGGEYHPSFLAPRRRRHNHSCGKLQLSFGNEKKYERSIRCPGIDAIDERAALKGRHFYRKSLESHFVNPDCYL